MNKFLEELLHNHSRTGLLLNELACEIQQLRGNVDALGIHIESLKAERDALRLQRDRLQLDAEYRALGETGRH